MQARPAVATALGVAAAVTAAPARAAPDDVITRPLVLAPGAIELRLTAEINLQVRELARPLALAPDAWWGVSPRWTIGVIHSDTSLDRIAAEASLCVRESALSACDRLYRGGGLDVRFGALAGPLAIAPRARVLVRAIDPFKPAVTLGALARWTRGRFAITSDPYLRLPLASRALGNRAAIELPLWLAVQPAAGWMIALRTGFEADLAVLRDGGHVPFAVETTARVTDEVDLNVQAGWGSLFGPQPDIKRGTLMIAAGWRS